MKNTKKVLLIIVIVVVVIILFFLLVVRKHKVSVNQKKGPTVSVQTNIPISGPIVSDILVKNVNTTQATIIWKTNVPTTSQILYGLSPALAAPINSNQSQPYQFSTLVDNRLNITHNININNLKPNTKYYYQIISFDKNKNQSSPKADSFITTNPFNNQNQKKSVNNNNSKTAVENLPINIYSTGVKDITSNGATIIWKTNVSGTSQVMYGTVSGLYSSSPVDSRLTTSHEVILNNLLSNQKIFYEVVSIDTKGNKAVSSESSFLVATVSVSGVPQVTFNPGSNSSVIQADLSWKTNVSTKTQILYGNAVSTSGTYNNQTLLERDFNLSHAAVLDNLMNNVKFYYRVVAIDEKGVKIISNEYSFSTPAANFILAKDIQSTSATITWNTPIKSVGKIAFGTVSGSYPLLTASEISPTTSHTIIMNSLQPKTKYYYQIISTGTGIVNTKSEEHIFSTL